MSTYQAVSNLNKEVAVDGTGLFELVSAAGWDRLLESATADIWSYQELVELKPSLTIEFGTPACFGSDRYFAQHHETDRVRT